MPAGRPNRKSRRAAAAQTKTCVINGDTLQELKDLKEDADLATAEAQAIGAKFQVAVARAFRKAKAPIQESAICLNCGTVRPRIIPACPECPPTEQRTFQPQPAPPQPEA